MAKHPKRPKRPSPSWKVSFFTGNALGLLLFACALMIVVSIPTAYNNDDSIRRGMQTILFDIPLTPFTLMINWLNINLPQNWLMIVACFGYMLYGGLINVFLTRWVPFYAIIQRTFSRENQGR